MLNNAKHEHFAHLVAKGETPPKAYVKSGFSERGAAQSANRLLKNADVSARIAQLRKSIEEPARERAIEKAAVDKAWVLEQLIEVVHMAKATDPVLDRDGNPTGELKQNLAAANKALELIGKEFAMFVDRKVVQTGPLDDLEHEELKKLQKALDDITRGPDAGIKGATQH
jgi:phage terminase small subunit